MSKWVESGSFVRDQQLFRISLISMKVFTAVIALLLGLSGCTKDDEIEDSDEISRASYLIDKGHYSEAIYTLHTRVHERPLDVQARVLLASAYAARGGLFLSSYRGFADEMLKWEDRQEMIPAGSDDPFLDDLAIASLRVHLIVRAFDSLPVVSTPSAYQDLTTAVSILEAIPQLTGGPSIYRALLRTARFKHDLLNVNRFPSVNLCQVEIMSLVQWITKIESELRGIVEDVAGGIADQAAKEKLHALASELDMGLEEAAKQIQAKSKSKDPILMNIPWALRRVSGSCPPGSP